MPGTSSIAESSRARTSVAHTSAHTSVARAAIARTATARTPVARTLVAGALTALAVVTTACGTPAARRPGAAFAPMRAADLTRSGSHVMTASDFSHAVDAPNALAAIERLRPLFLRPRPSFGSLRGQMPVISVFVNGAYAGGPDALRVIGADAVASARFLQPTEAITTLGARYAADGVIMVQLKGFRN